MKVSANGVDFICGFEGFRSTAYYDATGTLTIGYGHTSGVYPGQTITKAQGEAFMASDLSKVENALNQYDLGLNQNQFDAMADLLFNTGTGVLNHFVTLILNDPNDPAITEKINEYVDSKGVKLDDLVERRAKDVELYKKKVVI